jgi:hypothetical protein
MQHGFVGLAQISDIGYARCNMCMDNVTMDYDDNICVRNSEKCDEFLCKFGSRYDLRRTRFRIFLSDSCNWLNWNGLNA